jgi:hypothetical protein
MAGSSLPERARGVLGRRPGDADADEELMGTILRTNEPELRDLARNSPPLVEAGADRFTGARLVSCVGTGGMSTVFLAQLDPRLRSDDLSPLTPTRFAVKFMQLATFLQFQRLNQDPGDLFLREVVALSRIAERRPPSEFVVGFYGSGYADIAMATGDVKRLPWLAIDYVDGGTEGVTLTERVERATGDGIDPIRALRLVRGLFQGVSALHGEGILHRDLKPDNVLIAGPVDDETPKLADCGVARVEGIVGTVAGMTPAYGGPEQILSVYGVHNALIGPWTDVHALSAVVWFILGGCDWCRGDADPEWQRGMRRTLRSAPRVHPGFVWDPRALEQLDAVLARAAAPRLPAEALSVRGATETLQAARGFLPILTLGVERFASVAKFQDALLPILERCAAAWMARAGIENRAVTAFRPTQLVRARTGTDELRANIRELPPKNVTDPSAPGSAVFQPDGRILCRFGERLRYFIDDEAHKVNVPPEHAEQVASSTWVTRGPGGGFALIGPAHVLLVRGGRFTVMDLPERRRGGEVGEIQAVVDDGRVFGIVTAETDDSNGGPELWQSMDGSRWGEPVVLPLSGDARSVAYGPYGFLVVGSRRGTRARALFLGFDGQPVVYVVGVNDKPPLRTSVCGAGREAWAAGEGMVLSFDRNAVREEPVEASDVPVAMALDLVGAPWLITNRYVLRRHAHSGSATWRIYHERSEDKPPLVGLGFTPEGARVLDARGGGLLVTPRDIESWRVRTRITQTQATI